MKFGPHVGQTKAQIIAAVTESKQRAMAAYAAPGTPEQRTARLIAAIKECVPKPPKPNE